MELLSDSMDQQQPIMEADMGTNGHEIQIGRCVGVDEERASRMVRKIQGRKKY